MVEVTESGVETIQRVLSAYEIGRKIRQLRLRKKMGLKDLGAHTGLSASMLSQLETGKMAPTLQTLARISMVFDVGIDHFFSDRAKRTRFSVVRAAERMRFPERADAPRPAFHFECLAFSSQEKSLQAYLAAFEPRELKQVTAHVHEGAEFIHVIEGVLGVVYLDEETELGAGDSVYFDSSQAHGYRAVGEGRARAVVVTTTPRI
ncbi:MAG: transcriptional regulator [Candidatus Solibacter sp.]|nr:transcriptional regulator [Candidatus Solibacter sp.]